MKRLIHILVDLPDIEATEEDIEEFITFQMNVSCEISCDNPFFHKEIEVNDYFIEDKHRL